MSEREPTLRDVLEAVSGLRGDVRGLGARFDGLESRVKGLGERIDGLGVKLDELDRTVRYEVLEKGLSRILNAVKRVAETKADKENVETLQADVAELKRAAGE